MTRICAVFCVMATILRAGSVILFDAGNPEQYKWSGRTCGWIKDSDLKPLSRITGETLEITYTGSQGQARTTFTVSGMDSLPPQVTVTGLRVTLDSNAKEYSKLSLSAFFNDDTTASFRIPLTAGMKTYTPQLVFRRAKEPINWRTLKLLCIDNTNPDLKLQIRSLALDTSDAELESAVVPVLAVRRVCEVLPTAPAPGQGLAPWTRFSDHQVIPAEESPLQVELSYGEQELLISARSEFESPPRAKISAHDGHVFTDEALELLFSPWRDNHKFMQFTINGAGAVFDLKLDFDPVAAEVVYNRNWSLPHRKSLSYQDSVQSYNLSFPLSELGFVPAKDRFINFQAAHHYDRERKHQTLCWNPTDRFPQPRNFGVLVFNNSPFGAGEINITRVSALTQPRNPNYLCFSFVAECTALPAGDYQLKLFLTNPQGTLLSKSLPIASGGQTTHEIHIEAFRQSGFYSAYLALENAAGDWKMAAVNYNYSTPLRDRFGEMMLCPEPKQMQKKDGVFDCLPGISVQTSADASDRSKRTAEMIGADLAGFVHTGGPNIVELSLQPGLSLPAEGYRLSVTPAKIIITGQDEAGLYRGTRTLLQLVKSQMQRDAALKIPCLEITDFPDLPNRIFRICHPRSRSSVKIQEFRGVEYLLDYIDRFAANQKYNFFMLDLSGVTRFPRYPAFNPPEGDLYSLEDWKRIADFCRERFIELIPALPAGSHEGWWLLYCFPHLAMPGFTGTGDVRNDEHNQIVFDCMGDLLDATGARYFAPKFDEWYSRRRSGVELLEDQVYYDAFWQFAGKVHGFLTRRKVRMLIFDDMLYPGTNGHRFDIYKGLDQLPRDVIILHWGLQPAAQIVSHFNSRGFEVWNSGTSYTTYKEETRPLLKGFGASPYSLGHSIELRDNDSTTRSQLPIFQAADVAWNFLRPGEHPTIIDRLADGTLPAWRNIAAVRPDPLAGTEVNTLDLSPCFNVSFADFAREHLPGFTPRLPVECKMVGNIPTKLTEQAVLLGQAPGLQLPLTGRQSSLTFLLGAWYPPALHKSKAYLKRGHAHRNWPYGYPGGTFKVRYQDGSTADIRLRLYESFNWLDTDSLYRATSDNRCVLPVEAGDGRHLFLYQYEWINPKPDCGLESITFEPTDAFAFKMLLFALSARTAR